MTKHPVILPLISEEYNSNSGRYKTMKWKLVFLLLVICILAGCGNAKGPATMLSPTDSSQNPGQTGLPAGMIQQTQVFYNGNLYKLSLVDYLSELPEDFSETGKIGTITPYDIPIEKEVGAGPDVFEGQLIFSSPNYNSAIFLQYGNGYITLCMDQLDMVLVNELEVESVRRFISSVQAGSVLNADQYAWSAEDMTDALHAATGGLTSEMRYAWIDSAVELKIQGDKGEDTLTIHFGKTENIIYMQLVTADNYLFRAISTAPELYDLLHRTEQ